MLVQLQFERWVAAGAFLAEKELSSGLRIGICFFFGNYKLRRESTLDFGPISMKLGLVVRFTKKMTLNKCGPGSGPNYGETAVCPLGREGNKWPKLRFSLYKHPQNGYSPLIIW